MDKETVNRFLQDGASVCIQSLQTSVVAKLCQTPWYGLYLQTGQNILLNAHRLRTFASLTTRNGGSYIRVFTV